MPRNRETNASWVGHVFGELTVIEFVGLRPIPNKSQNVPMMKVRCSCGNEKVVSLWDLKAGKTKTCRYNHPTYLDRSLPALNSLYATYKKRGEEKGAFEFTKEEFHEITQKNCFYCGIEPGNNYGRGGERAWKAKTGKYISYYVYNGLDRIDNSVPYTKENTVPCCYRCNHAKATMSQEEFYEWIDRLVDFRASTRSKVSLNFVQG